MYFEVKAFKGVKRRFENLDNINELNEFIDNFYNKGFDKFIIKSFDCLGLRYITFYTYKTELKRIYKSEFYQK